MVDSSSPVVEGSCCPALAGSCSLRVEDSSNPFEGEDSCFLAAEGSCCPIAEEDSCFLVVEGS